MRFLETKIPPAIVMIVFAVPGFWMHNMQIGTLEGLIWLRPLYVVFPILALLIIFAGIFTFRKHQTTINPHKPGETSRLVTEGIYSHTRNPMYVGMCLCLLAVAVKTANVAAFASIPFFIYYITKYQIVPEERAIEALFGEEFREYKKRVRRWI